ncbi:ABC transporter ATP-binding protein [Fuscibacter oryzae]|uniref:ABC transporter ATP-binding protein n=1 Tax=Fuscibacter oryzae TaxID=2803939 RepID=A0A8J7SVE2_9RHOB|nr:ABC transporter ATP-binding protein [Fuscibacter oryzae]MBL4929432.1 ABC transporter ATP-binding protein [Fuscibacter oryzae]
MSTQTLPVPDRTSIISMQGLEKKFGTFTALRDIDLDVREGEILTFLGPSGCGKTTLMRIIAGFEDPTAGSLQLRGADMRRLPPEKRPINMVFQRYALFPHLDVFDNVAFGLRLKNWPAARINERVGRMLKMVQMDTMATRWIHELSGGQSQRVALARALANEPQLLLLDEPLAALDLKIRHHMLSELKRIQRETGTTFVYVTHDQDEAMILSSRIVLMNHGRIEQLGTPDELYFHPVSLFAAKFLGETNILPAEVRSGAGDDAVLEGLAGRMRASHLPKGLADGQKVHVSIRPETVSLSDSTVGTAPEINGALAEITQIQPIGSRVVYTARLDNGTEMRSQTVRPPDALPLAMGQKVHLKWSEAAVAVLTA